VVVSPDSDVIASLLLQLPMSFHSSRRSFDVLLYAHAEKRLIDVRGIFSRFLQLYPEADQAAAVALDFVFLSLLCEGNDYLNGCNVLNSSLARTFNNIYVSLRDKGPFEAQSLLKLIEIDDDDDDVAQCSLQFNWPFLIEIFERDLSPHCALLKLTALSDATRMKCCDYLLMLQWSLVSYKFGQPPSVDFFYYHSTAPTSSELTAFLVLEAHRQHQQQTPAAADNCWITLQFPREASDKSNRLELGRWLSIDEWALLVLPQWNYEYLANEQLRLSLADDDDNNNNNVVDEDQNHASDVVRSPQQTRMERKLKQVLQLNLQQESIVVDPLTIYFDQKQQPQPSTPLINGDKTSNEFEDVLIRRTHHHCITRATPVATTSSIQSSTTATPEPPRKIAKRQ
jgi:hypothetical protein